MNGDREESWTADNAVLWLRDLLPHENEIGQTRILTYGYDAYLDSEKQQQQLSFQELKGHATDLLGKLANHRETTETDVCDLASESACLIVSTIGSSDDFCCS